MGTLGKHFVFAGYNYCPTISLI